MSANPAEATPQPKEGDFTLCIRCGAPHRFNADLTLRKASDVDMASLDEESAAQLEKARKLIRARAYERAAQAAHAVVWRFKAREPLPLFAMPAKEMVISADLRGIGSNLVRNRTADELLKALLAEADGATVLMLRVSLELCGIPYQVVPLAALGLEVGTT